MLNILNPKSNFQAFNELRLLLTRHRELTFELARRELTDRYVGQAFGLIWTFGHPLIVMLIYIFVFAFVFRLGTADRADAPMGYVTYLLSGLIPWLAVQEVMTKASTIIRANANVVKQVVFPIEVLPAKSVLTALFTQTVFMLFLVLYGILDRQTVLWTYILIPLALLLSAMTMIGLGFILSAVGAYLRDTKDFVHVFALAGIYLMPVFYQAESLPMQLRPLLYVNPFSHVIWCYQDIFYYGRIEHPYAWVIFVVLGFTLLSVGYRLFRRVRTLLGNVL
jgi:lipopolysaccharide transport system permease protein